MALRPPARRARRGSISSAPSTPIPALPDLYTRTAAELSHVSVSEVTKAMRQRGKVAELALGYCGGKNALQTMAAGYGMHLDDAEAQDAGRRLARGQPMGRAVRQGALGCDGMRPRHRGPPDPGRARRLRLSCRTISAARCCAGCRRGRCLTYRAIRYEMVDEKDDDGKVVKTSRELTYAKGHNRVKIWPGIFVENVHPSGRRRHPARHAGAAGGNRPLVHGCTPTTRY